MVYRVLVYTMLGRTTLKSENPEYRGSGGGGRFNLGLRGIPNPSNRRQRIKEKMFLLYMKSNYGLPVGIA